MLLLNRLQMRNVKIAGTGIYLPHKIVTSEELANELGVTRDMVFNKSGVNSRHYASGNETASYMGAKAANAAIDDAGLTLDDIDLILCASGSMEMPIPCTAVLIHKQLGLQNSTIPAFDVNATCLSFVAGLDVISYLIAAGKYKHVLIVSTEIASVGLGKTNLEVASLFGDGAAAAVISRSETRDKSHILASSMTTFSAGSDLCTISGGGSAYPPQNWTEDTEEKFQFKMCGKEVFRLASKQLPDFVQGLLSSCQLTLNDIDILVPHQASKSGIRIIGKKLNFSDERIVDIIENHGNMIAASIPLALHLAIKKGQIQRGNRVLLLGTSAGLSIGGMILTY
jgi:3-oxoacyl-[acyl-carrier-protein] synthase-3